MLTEEEVFPLLFTAQTAKCDVDPTTPRYSLTIHQAVELVRIAILKNTAKVLRNFEPAFQLQNVEIAYSSDQFAALMQERDAFEAQAEACAPAKILSHSTCPR